MLCLCKSDDGLILFLIRPIFFSSNLLSKLLILYIVFFSDIIEIFHITTFILFVLAQNILEAEGSWFGNFINVSTKVLLFSYQIFWFCFMSYWFNNNSKCFIKKIKIVTYVIFSANFRNPQNAILVYACELIIDIIKHAFLANFNDIKPDAYSDFLEDLCKQVFIYHIL